jgi:hypothetical protein
MRGAYGGAANRVATHRAHATVDHPRVPQSTMSASMRTVRKSVSQPASAGTVLCGRGRVPARQALSQVKSSQVKSSQRTGQAGTAALPRTAMRWDGPTPAHSVRLGPQRSGWTRLAGRAACQSLHRVATPCVHTARSRSHASQHVSLKSQQCVRVRRARVRGRCRWCTGFDTCSTSMRRLWTRRYECSR